MSAHNDLAAALPSPSAEEARSGALGPRPAAPLLALSMGQLAKALGDLDPGNVARNYRRWGIPHVRIGGRVVFPLAALERWLIERTEVAA